MQCTNIQLEQDLQYLKAGNTRTINDIDQSTVLLELSFPSTSEAKVMSNIDLIIVRQYMGMYRTVNSIHSLRLEGYFIEDLLHQSQPVRLHHDIGSN